jgi:hypothetical protein
MIAWKGPWDLMKGAIVNVTENGVEQIIRPAIIYGIFQNPIIGSRAH